MRSSIFSFSVRVIAFLAVVVVSLALVEHYCRTSIRFGTLEQYDIRNFTLSDQTNAVFGDSQVGRVSRIPGFSFFGTAAQQPSELLRLVHYLYVFKKPRKIILEMTPQWFGLYQIGRREFVTEEALPPRYLKLLTFSPYFYRPLKGFLLTSIFEQARSVIARASAEDLKRPSAKEVNELANRWLAAIKRAGVTSDTFDWSSMPAKVRTRLTLARVYDQNPRAGFEAEPAAHTFETAIHFLLDDGAQICFFRTPVTAEFRRLAALIPGSNYAAFHRYADALAKRLGIRWVQYTDLKINFTDDLFTNQDHLNERGHKKMWSLVYQACFSKS